MTRATERDWTFGGTWPYDPHWFDTPDGRLHFVDVGPRAGQPVVLVHGNPTWGYLYRHFIPPLVAAGHRVIVPDHLGFGRSDKPPAGAAHQVERHAGRLGACLIRSICMRPPSSCMTGVVLSRWRGRFGARRA